MYSIPASQVVDGFERLRQSGTEPTARPLSRELFDDIERSANRAALILHLVHRLLIVAVRVELPAALEAGIHGTRIGFAAPRIERDRRSNCKPVEDFSDAPESDAHPIFMPAPIGVIGQLRLPLRRRYHYPRHRA